VGFDSQPLALSRFMLFSIIYCIIDICVNWILSSFSYMFCRVFFFLKLKNFFFFLKLDIEFNGCNLYFKLKS
jgi:hypothetical protein